VVKPGFDVTVVHPGAGRHDFDREYHIACFDDLVGVVCGAPDHEDVGTGNVLLIHHHVEVGEDHELVAEHLLQRPCEPVRDSTVPGL